MEVKIAKKRPRSENWLDEDKIILSVLVKERVRIIENKSTDSDTNCKKAMAWADLQKSFNCMCKGSPRDISQLKNQWGVIKLNAKRQKASESKVPSKAEGSSAVDPLENQDICVWLPNENHEIDSDQIILIDNDETVPQQLEQVTQPKPAAAENLASPASQIAFKPVIKKKINPRDKTQETKAAENKIAVEIECMKELHQAKLATENMKAENERKKGEVLALQEYLVRIKTEYYRKMLMMPPYII